MSNVYNKVFIAKRNKGYTKIRVLNWVQKLTDHPGAAASIYTQLPGLPARHVAARERAE